MSVNHFEGFSGLAPKCMIINLFLIDSNLMTYTDEDSDKPSRALRSERINIYILNSNKKNHFYIYFNKNLKKLSIPFTMTENIRNFWIRYYTGISPEKPAIIKTWL